MHNSRLPGCQAPILDGAVEVPYSLIIVPLLRWLLPLVAALALVGQAATTYAAAGVVGSLHCCCPDLAHCKCSHEAPKTPTMKSCGQGDAKLVEPAVQVATTPVIALAIAVQTTSAVVHAPMFAPEDRPIEIEKPPF